MAESRSGSQKRWLSTLLLLTQLAGWSVAAVHANDAGLPAADHVETPGSHPAGHDAAACPTCRLLDLRPAPVVFAPPVPSDAAYGSCTVAVALNDRCARPRLDSAAPRAPPTD